MNKLTYTVFIAFWSVAGTLLAVHVLSPPVAAGSDAAGSDTLPAYTLEEVAAHVAEDDCWMIIEGKVYDFTDYIPQHPTPPFVMGQWCGREATEGMRTKGYGRDHSPAAWGMMDEYLVGTLRED